MITARHLLTLFLLSSYTLLPSHAHTQGFPDSKLMKWVGVVSDIGGGAGAAVGALQLLGQAYAYVNSVESPTIRITKVTFKQPDKFYIGDERVVTVELTANWVENNHPAVGPETTYVVSHVYVGNTIRYTPPINYGHYVQIQFYLDEEMIGAYRSDAPNTATGDATTGDFKFVHTLEARNLGTKEFKVKAFVYGRVKTAFWKPDYSDLIETEMIIDNTLVEDPFGPPELDNKNPSIKHGDAALIDLNYSNLSSKNGVLRGAIIRTSDNIVNDQSGTSMAYRRNSPLPPKQKVNIIPLAAVYHDGPAHDVPSRFYAKGMAFGPQIILHDLHRWSGANEYFNTTNVYCDSSKKENGTLIAEDFTDLEKKAVERVIRATRVSTIPRKVHPKQKSPTASDPVVLTITDLADSTNIQIFTSDDSGRFLIFGLFGPLVTIKAEATDYQTLLLDSIPTEQINMGLIDTIRLYPQYLPVIISHASDQNGDPVKHAVYRIRDNDTSYLGFSMNGSLTLRDLTRLDLNNGKLTLRFSPATEQYRYYNESSLTVTIDSLSSFADTMDIGLVMFHRVAPSNKDSVFFIGRLMRKVDSTTTEILKKVKLTFYDSSLSQTTAQFTTDDSGIFVGTISRFTRQMIIHLGEQFPECITNDTIATVDFSYLPDTTFIDSILYNIPCQQASVKNIQTHHTKTTYYFSQKSLSLIPEMELSKTGTYSIFSTLGSTIRQNISSASAPEILAQELKRMPTGVYFLCNDSDGTTYTIMSTE